MDDRCPGARKRYPDPVGELAADAVPRQLVLTHLLPASRSDEDELAYVNEVRAGGFDGPVIVARDRPRIAVEPL